jgi:Tol biopolymer transport system component
MLVIILVALMAGAQQQTAEQLFQSGVYAEEVEGNLSKAIDIYSEILERFPDNIAVGAKAQLHLGFCYEKLGRTEAIKAYERVLKKFGGQAEQVAAARERLAALQMEIPSGISSLKILEGPNAGQAVAISPDGTQVLILRDDFVGKNLYIYDLSSKKLDYITHYVWSKGDPGVGAARWSPDGTEIVFMQSGPGLAGPAELVVSTLEGKVRILHRVEDKSEGALAPIAWLADDSAILTCFMRPDRTATLGLVPMAGGSFKAVHTLKGKAKKHAQIADASPDAHFIVFQDRGPQGKHDLYIIGMDGTSLEVLSDHPADERSPRWSPDGRHIVFKSQRHGTWALWGIAVQDGKPVGEAFFIREGDPGLGNWTKHGLAYTEILMVQDIYIAPIDPGSLEIKGKPRQIDYAPTGGNVCPVWSPDGKSLAFVAFNKLTGENKIVVVSVDGAEPREFPNAAQNKVPLAIHDLCWLPDGSGLSLSDYTGRGNPQTLHLLDLRTGAWKSWSIPVKNWTPTAWNKDGKSFLYQRRGQDKPGIIEHNVDTGAERYVYTPAKGERGVMRQLKLTKDYKKLAFTKGSLGIIQVDMETGTYRELKSEQHGSLSWSPDGQHIISTGARDDLGFPTALFVISVADGSAKKLELGYPEGQNFFDPTWSPDGRQIAFMAQSMKVELFLMKNIIPPSPQNR